MNVESDRAIDFIVEQSRANSGVKKANLFGSPARGEPSPDCGHGIVFSTSRTENRLFRNRSQCQFPWQYHRYLSWVVIGSLFGLSSFGQTTKN
jgi:hypothetical protein